MNLKDHTAETALWDGPFPHLLEFVPLFLTQEIQSLDAAMALTLNPGLPPRCRQLVAQAVHSSL